MHPHTLKIKKKSKFKQNEKYVHDSRGKTCEMPNLVSWEFTLESVACKLPRWPVNFQGVAGKFPKKILKVFPNFEISFDTITLRQ